MFEDVFKIDTGQAVILGFIGGLALISWIYSFFYFNKALLVSALVGITLGEIKEALIFGAAAELIYLGLINAAGVIPPNPLGPGLFGVIVLLNTKYYPAGTTTFTEDTALYHMDLGTAITLSLPFAIFIQFLITVIFTVVTPIGKMQQELIKKEKWILYRATGHTTAVLLFISGFALGLLAGLAYEPFGNAIKEIPKWLQKGMGVGGGMLPAMGFAVVLRLMLKKEYIPFLLVGFTLVVIFESVEASKPEWGFNLVALTIAAVAMAMVVFNSGALQKTEPRRGAAQTAKVEGESDGI